MSENKDNEVMFITGDTRNNDILILANAINYNAKILQKVLDKISKLEKEEKIKFTNSEWKDFLCKQFDVSRTTANEMLHALMALKKEDNFKKLFNGGNQDGRKD